MKVMAPPRKRQRVSGQNQKSSGKGPETMSDVPAARIALRDWINDVYSGRHGWQEKRKYPLNHGGTFLDVVQRCFADGEAMVEESLDLAKTLGIIASDATEEVFMGRFMKLKDGEAENMGLAGFGGIQILNGDGMKHKTRLDCLV